jgi:hypothetical protein
LSAFHDGELSVKQQIAVEAHLRTCLVCTAELANLRRVGDLLRAAVAPLTPTGADDWEVLQATLLNRMCVEREESLPAQVGRMFEDMRLGFAALGSTAATLVSILLMIGIFYFGPRSERPDSLAGVMETLSAHQIGTDSSLMMPRPSGYGAVVSSDMLSEEDAVFALAAVVTRNGRLVSLESLSAQPTSKERERILRLLDEMSRARFEPARVGGSPVAVRTVWLVAHTTVRGKLPPLPSKQSSVSRASRMILS